MSEWVSEWVSEWPLFHFRAHSRSLHSRAHAHTPHTKRKAQSTQCTHNAHKAHTITMHTKRTHAKHTQSTQSTLNAHSMHASGADGKCDRQSRRTVTHHMYAGGFAQLRTRSKVCGSRSLLSPTHTRARNEVLGSWKPTRLGSACAVSAAECVFACPLAQCIYW